MSRDITCVIGVPGRGSRPSRWRFSWSRPDDAEGFEPPMTIKALVVGVPDSVPVESVRQAFQLVADANVALNSPCRFTELKAALARTGYEFTSKTDDAE